MNDRQFGVEQQFLRILGRPPRPDELEYMVGLMTDEAMSANEIGQVLQGMPEFQSRQLDQNAQKYGQALDASNQGVLNQAAATAQSSLASLGRPGSSAMGASILSAGGDLARQRQSALAQFYGQGLQQNQALTQGYGQNALARGYGLRDEKRQRGYQIEDYYRQKNDFASAKKAASGWNALTPEFITQGLFSLGGKAAAAMTGGMAGNAGGLPNPNQDFGYYPPRNQMGPSWNG